MAKIPFDYLTLRKQKRFRNLGWTKKENTGIDTETFKGYAKLICDNEGNYKLIESFNDIINFLTSSRFENKFNWFYNIRFDFEAIIKYLEYHQLQDLYHDNKIKIGFNTIKYLPKKFFSITTKNNNHRYYFYDMYNFLDISLEKASLNYLHDSKLKGVNSKKLNTDINYWNKNLEKIIRYCIKDAKLTKRLADYFWNIVYKNMKYYPKRPFSKGKISEEYFLQTCYIPTINLTPLKVLETAYNSYYGGRFELLKKGYFEKIYSYDIKSAYPKQISELIDFTKGEWFKTIGKLNSDAHSGFYLCEVSDLEINFSPFLKKIGELSIYPNGKFNQYLTKREIEFIMAYFENSSIKIKYGYEFYPKQIVYPFKNEIERLYNWKEKEKDADIKYAIKIFMNAFYGKNIQVAGESNLIGKIFNPMYASEITSGTRIELMKLGLQYPDDIIMFSTDSIHSEKKLKVPKNPKLGDFSFEFSGEGVYLMSDIYNLWNDKKQRTKIRGFSKALEKDREGGEVYLKDLLSGLKNDTIYKYETKRTHHLGECLIHYKKLDISDMNIFKNVKKSIDINGDKKRIWDSQFYNGEDCLRRKIESLPIKI